MNKYTDIEIQTAKNLLDNGYKWIARDESGSLFAYCDKPIKLYYVWGSFGDSVCVSKFVPIFQNIRFGDKEPVSLEAIVHPQILDDAERKYLSAVISPFRETVMWIKKYNGTYSEVNYESIVVCVEGDFARKTPFSFCLPAFKTGTMYKGMEIGRKYTLKELGL